MFFFNLILQSPLDLKVRNVGDFFLHLGSKCFPFYVNWIILILCFSDMTRHPSTDSTPSDSGSSPTDSGSSPSPSTPQKLLPACTSPFGPRIFPAKPSSSGTPRPQPEGSDHRSNNPNRLSGQLGGHGPCGRHVPLKMERIKVFVGLAS